jgi:hypothetical protein
MLLWWGLGPKRLRLPHCCPKPEAGSQGSKPGAWRIARQRLPQSITEELRKNLGLKPRLFRRAQFAELDSLSWIDRTKPN